VGARNKGSESENVIDEQHRRGITHEDRRYSAKNK